MRKKYLLFLDGDYRLGFLLMLPCVILMTVFIVYPLFLDLFYSFFLKHLIMPKMRFVGFRNYVRYLQDPVFWNAVKNGAVWTFSSVFFQLLIGLGTAILLNQKLKGIYIARGLIILPWITPVVVVVIIWKWIFNEMYGIVNHLLGSLGLFQHGVRFFSDPQLAMPTVIAMNVWWGYPFMTIVLLAGLKSIDQTLYEAAKVDGASIVQEFIYITLPGLRLWDFLLSSFPGVSSSWL